MLLLSILGEHEGNEMSYVEGVRGPSPGVEEEGLALLDLVEDGVHVSVGEEDPPSEEVVHRLPGDLLHPVQEDLVDLGAAKLF